MVKFIQNDNMKKVGSDILTIQKAREEHKVGDIHHLKGGQMVRFQSEKIETFVTKIYGMNAEQMYLIEGSEKAALIDTGSGVGDLHKVVSSLTDKPILVLLSHGHVDHAMGAPQFDEVYMSYQDDGIYQDNTRMEIRKSYLSTSVQFAELEEQDYLPDRCYLPARQASNIHDLKDGDLFDLGDITIEAVACAGHTPGSMMFLIREKRILFAGDACTFFTMLQGDTCLGLTTYQKNLLTAKMRTDGKYDQIYMSHSNLTAPVTLIDEVLEVCEQIKRGEDDKIPFGYLGTNGAVAKAFGNNGISAYARLDGKVGNLVYRTDRIWE